MKPETEGKIKYGVWGLVVGGGNRNDHRFCVGGLDNLGHES